MNALLTALSIALSITLSTRLPPGCPLDRSLGYIVGCSIDLSLLKWHLRMHHPTVLSPLRPKMDKGTETVSPPLAYIHFHLHSVLI